MSSNNFWLKLEMRIKKGGCQLSTPELEQKSPNSQAANPQSLDSQKVPSCIWKAIFMKVKVESKGRHDFSCSNNYLVSYFNKNL